jgi:type I restriction enzyme M protein
MATGNAPEYTIADILKATDDALTIFEDKEKAAIELFNRKGKPYLRDFVGGKERPAKPEEIVRQQRYEETGSWYSKQSRDVLFIERNLEFLRASGRMAIVLPQGRFNNISDTHVRSWISERARILAVVGLHVNTFKPHTGPKTSVLFLQKWNNDKKSKHYCPKVEDYPIFFATSERSSKDNSGEYLCRIGEDGKAMLGDHGHLVIDDDLNEIADAFVDFARK